MKKRLTRTILIVLAIFDVFLIVALCSNYYYTQPIKPNITLPTPIGLKIPYEYCEKEYVAPASAGNPEKEDFRQTSKKMFVYGIRIKPADNFERKNFHIVIVGVGIENNEEVLKQKAKELENIFTGIDIDFAYLKDSVNIDFVFYGRQVLPADSLDATRLVLSIRLRHPADGILVFINTDRFMGTRYNSIVMVPVNNRFSNAIAVHEIGHLFRLGEGYRDFLESSIPNSELFYLDLMPRHLVTALQKLDEIPPLYEAGTCHGKKVYTFYKTENNIMGNYAPMEPNSWGESMFTPLQIEIINTYIEQIRN